MSLYKQWVDLMEGQTEETFEAFWEEYSGTETRIYENILENKDVHLAGKFSELVEKFEANPVIFMGFLDGIQTSLNNPFDLEKAEAEYLYTLPQWENILSEEKMIEIIKDYKRSRTVHKEKEPGRNDPCPCGSGKKYKKCCGANK